MEKPQQHLTKEPAPPSAGTTTPVVDESQQFLKELKPARLIWPILIGVGVLGYTVYSFMQEGRNPFTEIAWTGWVFGMLGLAFVAMTVRDFGYMWRLRLLTDNKLSWRNTFQIVLLWEFASSLTPSVVGGSAVAIFMLMKEKISAGRGTAIIFMTIFLDEIFYLIILPVVLLVVKQSEIFGPVNDGVEGMFGSGLIVSFWIAYSVIFIYTVFLAFALFIKPEATSNVVKRLVKTRLLKRWEESGTKMADELLISAKEFRKKNFAYWAKAWMATMLAWMGRYLSLNIVLAAFTALSFYEHTVAFARQAVMFVLMIVSPTPGSGGVAEWAFSNLFAEFSPDGFVMILAVVWRLVSYYPYLLIGIVVFFFWFRRVFGKKARLAA
ncbi:MAG: lysylphosphatidylglycerol synthase transmembrane domain-containing protein [Bacteroidota bacterium]